MLFQDIVERAQRSELEEFEQRVAAERKQAEALRKLNYPGTIGLKECLAPRDEVKEDPADAARREKEAASRKAALEASNAKEVPVGAYPPPPITTPG